MDPRKAPWEAMLGGITNNILRGAYCSKEMVSALRRCRTLQPESLSCADFEDSNIGLFFL